MTELRQRKEGVEHKAERPQFTGLGRRSAKAEAKNIETMMRVQCSTMWSDQDNEVFVLPSKWLSCWKNCVQSGELESGNQPGPVVLSDIMLNPDLYYHPLSTESQLDRVLKETSEEDYHIASKELWESLRELYGGEEAIRYRFASPAGRKHLDLNFSGVL